MNETPTFVRLDHFNQVTGEWFTGHGGINLIDPQRYVEKMTTNGKIVRALDPFTGEVVASNEDRFDLDLPDHTNSTTEEPEMEDDFDDLAEFDEITEPLVSDAEDEQGWGDEEDEDAELAALLAEVNFNGRDDDPSMEDTGSAIFIGMPDTKDFIFDGHAGAGPSGADRWMNCTMSLSATRAFLETLTYDQQVAFAKSSDAARQGTTAHAAAETEARLMLGQIEQVEFDNIMLDLTMLTETDAEAYDDEMGEWLQEYGELIRNYAQTREVLIEQRVQAAVELMTATDGEQDVHVINGSADAIVLPSDEEPVLTVADLKYGNGVDVTVEGNPQVRIYGLGALAKLVERGYDLADLDHIEYVIQQPRLGGTKVWTESLDDLFDWVEQTLSPALTEALGGRRAGASFTPSEKACHFCPARGSCPALAEDLIEKGKELFDVIQDAEFENGPGAFPETELLDDEQLASLYSQVKGLVKIEADLKAELQRRLHRGDTVPGYHLVNYSPPRHWDEGAEGIITDEDAFDQDTAALMFDTKMMSPTKALAALKAAGVKDPDKVLGDLIVKPDPRPVAAPVGDRRKKWEARPPEAMFDNLDEED